MSHLSMSPASNPIAVPTNARGDALSPSDGVDEAPHMRQLSFGVQRIGNIGASSQALPQVHEAPKLGTESVALKQSTAILKYLNTFVFF